jgi:hypothetical protein
MSKLYFGICPYGSLVDVFINLLAGWSDNWLQPCAPDINRNGYPIHRVHEPYVLQLTNNKPLTFRDIDWRGRMSEIEDVLRNANNKDVWIGTFDPSQAELIKNYFDDNATIVGISYGADQREVVLNNAICYYDLSDIDDPVLRQPMYLQKYKADKAKWDARIPKEFIPDAEILFDIKDFFNPEIFIAQVEAFNGKRNEKQLAYYYDWFYKNQGDRK